MPEGKHTPAPWANWGEDEVPEGIPVLEIVRGESGPLEWKQIAYVQPSLGDDGNFYLSDEDHANARLIASAPDLLKAAQIAEAVICTADATEGEKIEAVMLLQAAISKARGNS